MKAAEKAKAQKVIDKIQDGRFDENDIDNLFMRLRAYSGEHRVFREIADFVAHNDSRYKGMTNASLEAFYLSLQYFVDYPYQDKALDVSHPIPLYIKKLMKYQVDKCDPEQLRSEFKVTPERLKSRIDNYFRDDKKAKTTELQPHKVGGAESFASIRHLLGFIGSVPAFTAETLMQDLLGVLKSNKLAFDENAVISRQPAIVLCVMLLMHQTSFEFSENAKGHCTITSEQSSIMKGLPMEEFGELQVMGTVGVVHPSGAVLPIGFPVFVSGLQAAEYCDASLLIEDVVSEDPSLQRMQIHLDRDLLLLDGSRLGPIISQ